MCFRIYHWKNFEFIFSSHHLATVKDEDLLLHFEDNEHHIDKLAKFKSNNNLPLFFLLKTSQVQLFSAESKKAREFPPKSKGVLQGVILQEDFLIKNSRQEITYSKELVYTGLEISF